MGSENKKKKLVVCKVNVFCEIREHLEAWFSIHLQQYNAGVSLLICKAKSTESGPPATLIAEAFMRPHVDATYNVYPKKYFCQLG